MERTDKPKSVDLQSRMDVAGSSAPISALEPFMGMKVRRRSSVHRIFKGDYLDLGGNSTVLKLLSKQGDKAVLFADAIMKVDRRSRLHPRLLLITDQAVYFLQPDSFRLKRRIALELIEQLRLSELNDNFFAMAVPAEYDCLLASTRKTEIVTVLAEATKKLTGNAVTVKFDGSFRYSCDSEASREVQFEEVEGGVTTTITAVK